MLSKKTREYFMPVESLTLCKHFCSAECGIRPAGDLLNSAPQGGFAPQLPCARWRSGEAVHPAGRASSQAEPVCRMGISTHWSFHLVKESTDSSCSSEIHRRDRGADVRWQNADFCQIQSKTPTVSIDSVIYP